VRDDSTPTQRKQVRLKAKQTASILKSTEEPWAITAKVDITQDQLWDEWELEARQKTHTQDEWQSYMNEKTLEVTRKTYPRALHAIYGGKPSHLTPELHEKLFRAVTKEGSTS